MPSNEQRREAAKRKLERQLENRASRAKRRKQLSIAGAVVGVVVLVGAGVLVWSLTSGDDASEATEASTTPSTTVEGDIALPAGRSEPLPDTVSCTYTPGGEAAKANTAPQSDNVPTTDDAVSFSVDTSQGNIGLLLNATESPCTVNSFASLAGQGYFDGTICHRLTSATSLGVLQCGDPTGTGSGGPGYQFADEFPTDTVDPNSPDAGLPVTYPRGTLAMANAGPGTNGSQFFLVYQDSQLPPNYTVFGTIDDTGLETLDKIAEAGVAGGGQDGAPALETTINSVLLD